MDFAGKTIWITGASSGIGRAVALELSQFDTRLILSGRNSDELNQVAGICNSNGCSVRTVRFDLLDEKSIMSAADEVLRTEERIDCLYHFGGISQRSFVTDTPLHVDRKIFEVNFFGTVALTKAVLPVMIKKGGGHIAATSSIVGKLGFPYRSAYSASKHALHGFFESLRAENVSNNIRVSMIIPGRIKTNISLNALDKNGNKHGKMDEGQDKGMSAGKAAKIICKKLGREKKEILVGSIDLLMIHIRRFFPFLYYHLSSKVKPL